MPEAMSGMTEQAFEAFGLISQDIRAKFAAERAATAAIVGKLEAKYADRGLKFTQPFYGGLPVQAFGQLDDLRFYFRFRHNWASIRLGPYDAAIEELTHLRHQQQDERKWAETEADYQSGKIDKRTYDFNMSYSFAARGVTLESDPDFLPTRILRKASMQGPGDEDDGYLGFLSDVEAFEVFSRLIEHLEDVPEAEQLRPHERVWLYEGLDAADAFWAGKYAPREPEPDKGPEAGV